ncbi:MAG: tetratricopeptide repeat protein [Elusimicrobia bacterium]|nr:tetratricopeptide repeat protein [Elusimicrobiota bacterium]
MPFSTVLAALVSYHCDRAWRPFWDSLPVLLVSVLVFAFGALAGSMLLGFSGTLLFHLAVLEPSSALWGHPQPFYAVLVALVGCLSVWRARSPTFANGTLLGLAIGVSLLYRSPLALFPLVLAFYEWTAVHRLSLRSCWRQVLPLVVIPYLMLLPVVLMIGTANGRLSVFEGKAIYNNILTATAGTVSTVAPGQDWEVVVYDVDPHDGKAVIGRAVETASRHPGRFIRGIAARLFFAVSLQPFLTILCLVSLWRHRAREELRPPALLALYFILAHCLMSVRAEYFTPLWPVLAGLAAQGLAGFGCGKEGRPAVHWLRAVRYGSLGTALAGAALNAPAAAGVLAFTLGLSASGSEDQRARRVGRGLALAVLVPALAGGAHVLGLTVRYRAMVKAGLSPGESIDAAIAAAPGQDWLYAARARERLTQGDFNGAGDDYLRASALRPGTQAWAIDWAWARMLGGRFGPLLLLQPPGSSLEGDWGKLHVARSAAYGRLGQDRHARDELKRGLEFWLLSVQTDHLEQAHDEAVARNLKSMEYLVPMFFQEYIKPQCWLMLSAQDAAAMAARLLEFAPGNPRLKLFEAEELLRAGEKRRALSVLRGLDRSKLGRTEAALAATLWGSAGQPASTADAKSVDAMTARGLRRRRPTGPSGRSSVETLAVDPSTSRKPEIAGPSLGLGGSERFLPGSPQDAGGAGGGAAAATDRSAGKAGDRGAASGALLRAKAGASRPGDMLALVKGHAGAGERTRAAEAAGRLMKEGGRGLSVLDWLEVSRACRKAGEAGQAKEALVRGEKAAKEAWEGVELARESLEAEAPGLAAGLVRRELGGWGTGLKAGQWVELGRVAGEAGEKGLAVKCLDRAQAAGAEAEELRMIAMRYQGLKEYGKALGILDGLAAREPGKGTCLGDRGVLKWLMGDSEGAAADLREAVRLEPENPEMALSLGSVLESAGKEGEALKVYEDALRLAGAWSPEANRTLLRLRSERDRLEGRKKAAIGAP